ncbi:MAG: hypothetical protein ACKV22_09125 [Bryobacteraceae bacterium]
MDITMPLAFPIDEFRAFLSAASRFLAKLLSDEDLNDPLQRKRHFDWSWQAVRYRYRSCAEANDEFKALLGSASEWWKAGWGDEEMTYRLERCIYTFFMSGLSVFDSFAFCLYYLGNALNPAEFPCVVTPRKISRERTAKAFGKAFPTASVTSALVALGDDPRFQMLDHVRNLVAHRLSGRRSASAGSIMNADGTFTERWHKEKWHIPGISGELMFDEDLLQRQLDDITDTLKPIVDAAREFAEAQPAQAST